MRPAPAKPKTAGKLIATTTSCYVLKFPATRELLKKGPKSWTFDVGAGNYGWVELDDGALIMLKPVSLWAPGQIKVTVYAAAYATKS